MRNRHRCGSAAIRPLHISGFKFVVRPIETVVETAAVEMIEQPTPVTVTEVEEIREAS
jgi:hypothetical protein